MSEYNPQTEYFEVTHDLVSRTDKAMDVIRKKIAGADHRGYCLVSSEFLQYLETLLDIQNHYTRVQTEALATIDEDIDSNLVSLGIDPEDL